MERKKYVITATVAIMADSEKDAIVKYKERIQARNGQAFQLDILIDDSDTKIESIYEGIPDGEKIILDGFDGVKVETAIGRKVMTKYGEELTVKTWDSKERKLTFEESDVVHHESRIAF